MLAGGETFVVCGVGGQVLVPALGKLTAQHALKFSSFCGVFAAVVRQSLIPLSFLGSAAFHSLAVLVVGLLRDFEWAVGPSQLLACEFSFLFPKRGGGGKEAEEGESED